MALRYLSTRPRRRKSSCVPTVGQVVVHFLVGNIIISFRKRRYFAKNFLIYLFFDCKAGESHGIN